MYIVASDQIKGLPGWTCGTRGSLDLRNLWTAMNEDDLYKLNFVFPRR
jgi:hypothetical protein